MNIIHLESSSLRRLSASLSCLLLIVSVCLSAAFAQGQGQPLPGQLKQLYSDIIKMTSSVSQFLQGGGRFLPAPQGDDKEMMKSLKDFHENVMKLKTDIEKDEPVQKLRDDMQNVKQSYADCDYYLPKVGGNKDVAADWNVVCRETDTAIETFDATYGNALGMPKGDTERQPTVPEVVTKMVADTQQFQALLGGFLISPGRIPPPHDEDLQLVHSLKQFQNQMGALKQDSESGRAQNFIQESVKQLRYTATKMDGLVDIIGAGPEVIQKWQQVRSNVEGLNDLVGNAPPPDDQYNVPFPQTNPAPSVPPSPDAGSFGQPPPSTGGASGF